MNRKHALEQSPKEFLIQWLALRGEYRTDFKTKSVAELRDMCKALMQQNYSDEN